MDALQALELQLAWGADEALDETPVDRLARPAAMPASAAPPLAALLAAAPLAAPKAGSTPAIRARARAAGAPTIEALRQAVSMFEDCPLAATATHLVWSDGNPQAGIVLVGEAPGEEEDRTGLPFQGPAGMLLDRMLASIGLDRTRVLMTTLVPWRPPGGRAPTETEVQMCLPFLQRHLALLAPKVVVALGQLPARALTGRDESIRKLRGRWRETIIEGSETVVPVLPMLNPSTLLHTPSAKREAWADLLMLYHRITER